MALSPEDKGDVKKHLGKALANKVAKVTRDKKPQSDSLKKWLATDKTSAPKTYKPIVRYEDNRKNSVKTSRRKDSFIDRLEAHKREGASFDNGTWKPSKKGESFIQALERHKSQREFD